MPLDDVKEKVIVEVFLSWPIHAWYYRHHEHTIIHLQQPFALRLLTYAHFSFAIADITTTATP